MTPANVGVWYWIEFALRSWKRAELLLPMPMFDSTLLAETKLPLEMPNIWNGVAVLLVDRVHVAELHRAAAVAQPTKELRFDQVPVAGIELDRLLELPDALQAVVAEVALAAEADVRVLRVDRLLTAAVGVRRRRRA